MSRWALWFGGGTDRKESENMTRLPPVAKCYSCGHAPTVSYGYPFGKVACRNTTDCSHQPSKLRRTAAEAIAAWNRMVASAEE